MRTIVVLSLMLSLVGLAAGEIIPTNGNQLSPEDQQRETLRLISLLNSGDDDVRLDTVIRLSTLRTPAAARALASASADRSEEVRAAALVGIGNCGDLSFAPLVATSLLSDKSVLVRKCAAYALGKLRSDQSTIALSAASRDKDPEVRGAAVVALGELEDPASIPALIGALADKSDFVRERAARALGRQGRSSAAAVSRLIELLASDNGHGVKLHAAIALGEIGDRSASPALERATHDKDPYVSRAATESLKRISQSR